MDITLLRKFYRKECTPEEVKEVLEWFKHQDLPIEQEEKALALWVGTKSDSASKYDEREILNRIHARIDSNWQVSVNNPSDQKSTFNPKLWGYPLRISAVLAVLILFTWIYKKESQSIENKIVTAETPSGQKLTRVLKDGTTVILNSLTSISYTEQFSDTAREVTLIGEAFFDVARDPDRPFTVHFGDVSTTALGTSFNIYYRPGDVSTRIALASGVVQVKFKDKKGKMQNMKLKPGEQLDYLMEEDRIEISEFDSLFELGWKDGILYFKNAGIQEIIQKLQNWYGVEITISENSEKINDMEWTYTGQFRNQSLETVLKGISFVKGFSFTIDKKKVNLSFN